MKRLLIIFFSIVLLASCQKESGVDITGSSTISYSLQTSVRFETKAMGEASAINVLWYGVYHKKSNGQYMYMSALSGFVEVTNPSDIKFAISLINGQEYKLVFVAQHRYVQDDKHVYMYTIGEDAVMKRNEASLLSNGECLDAFVYVDEIGPVTGSKYKSVTLERPFAQINFATVQQAQHDFDITIDGVPLSYNILERTYSQEKTSHVFENLSPVGGAIKVGGTDYNYLTTLYVFGGNKIDCTIVQGSTTKEISDIDTAPNFKTNIVGNI